MMGFFNRSSKKQSTTAHESEQKANPVEPKIYIQGAGACIVTKSILNGTSKLKWLFREESGLGNGWNAFGDTDSQDYVNDVNNLEIVDFNVLANIEPAVVNVFFMPMGADLEFCSDASGSYFVDTKTGQEIREPVKHPAQEAFERNLKFLNQENYPAAFFEGLFREDERTHVFSPGQANFPTGTVVMADPLAYLGTKYQTALERRIPVGSYPIELAVLDSEIAGPRIIAAKLKLGGKAERYELAMPKGTTIQDVGKPKVLPFLGVDTGLACFADEITAEAYHRFMSQWQREHSDKNIYTDYFEEKFDTRRRAETDPMGQQVDVLTWAVPDGGDHSFVLFSSGMGDGIYSGYWGLDVEDRPVELIVPFMNPEYF